MSTVRLNKIRTTGGKDILLSAGSVINVSEARNSTQVAFSDAAQGVIWTGTINKIYGPEFTDLIVYAQINGRGNYSGQCGTYLEIGRSAWGGTVGQTGTNWNENARDYGFVYEYNPWGNQEIPIWGMNIYKDVDAGTVTFQVGWHVYDQGSGNKPFVYVNAGAGVADARARQSNSKVIVYEITKDS